MEPDNPAEMSIIRLPEPWEKQFFATLLETGLVTEAEKAAGVSENYGGIMGIRHPDFQERKERVLAEWYKRWREEFMESLAETGSYVKACEMADITPNTIYIYRNNDPQFKADCEAALERWILRDANGGVVRKKRVWEQAFLKAFAITGVVKTACQCVGIKSYLVHTAVRNWPDFKEAFDLAFQDAADLLEEEAIRRAYHGIDENVIHHGKLSWTWVDDAGRPVPEGTEGSRQIPLTVKKYSDTLLEKLLKAAKPEKYRENFRYEHANLDAEIAQQLQRLAASSQSQSPGVIEESQEPGRPERTLGPEQEPPGNPE